MRLCVHIAGGQQGQALIRFIRTGDPVEPDEAISPPNQNKIRIRRAKPLRKVEAEVLDTKGIAVPFMYYSLTTRRMNARKSSVFIEARLANGVLKFSTSSPTFPIESFESCEAMTHGSNVRRGW